MFGHLFVTSVWALQQDNGPKHTSKSSLEWLKTLEWPSQSLDLRGMDTSYGHFKYKVLRLF